LVTKNHDPLLYSANQNQVRPTNSLVQNSSDQNQLLPQPKFLPTPVNQERLCISTYLDEIKVLETIRWGIESSGSSEFRIIPEEGIDLPWRVHQTCQEPRDLARHLPYIANSSRRRLVPPSSTRFVPLMMLNPHEIKTSPTVIYSFPHQSSPPPPPRLLYGACAPRLRFPSLQTDRINAPLALHHSPKPKAFFLCTVNRRHFCPIPCFQFNKLKFVLRSPSRPAASTLPVSL